MADYVADFRTLAAGSSWNEEVLCDVFIKALNERQMDEFATRDIVVG